MVVLPTVNAPQNPLLNSVQFPAHNALQTPVVLDLGQSAMMLNAVQNPSMNVLQNQTMLNFSQNLMPFVSGGRRRRRRATTITDPRDIPKPGTPKNKQCKKCDRYYYATPEIPQACSGGTPRGTCDFNGIVGILRIGGI